jgi:hypothetical protein
MIGIGANSDSAPLLRRNVAAHFGHTVPVSPRTSTLASQLIVPMLLQTDVGKRAECEKNVFLIIGDL